MSSVNSSQENNITLLIYSNRALNDFNETPYATDCSIRVYQPIQIYMQFDK